LSAALAFGRLVSPSLSTESVIDSQKQNKIGDMENSPYNIFYEPVHFLISSPHLYKIAMAALLSLLFNAGMAQQANWRSLELAIIRTCNIRKHPSSHGTFHLFCIDGYLVYFSHYSGVISNEEFSKY